MLRILRPVANDRSIAVKELTVPYDEHYFESRKRIAQFNEWKDVEGGKIQVRESSDEDDLQGVCSC